MIYDNLDRGFYGNHPRLQTSGLFFQKALNVPGSLREGVLQVTCAEGNIQQKGILGNGEGGKSRYCENGVTSQEWGLRRKNLF